MGKYISNKGTVPWGVAWGVARGQRRFILQALETAL